MAAEALQSRSGHPLIPRRPAGRAGLRRVESLAVLIAMSVCLAGPPSIAETANPALLARLTPEQRQAYQSWIEARAKYQRSFDAYWATIEEKKATRRAKRELGQPISANDYVIAHPPKYTGPPLRADIAAIKAAIAPTKPEPDMPVVANYLAMARQHFGFVPEPTTEREFKRRYAVESLRVGLTKDQVLRVYALETGGRGTYDMQAGIDPETRRGKPISSALGYAQLLHANSVNELVIHGASFAQRLEAMAADPSTPQLRARQLRQKADVVRRMRQAAMSVPNQWAEHVKFAATPRGMGIHTLNLDADVGPWMQVLKLEGLRQIAAKAGRPVLSGAELELMNLAGPRTGLEMMEPAAHGASTANFFNQQGFYRNTIVREKSAIELLRALEERMNANLTKPGAIEFARIFDEVSASRVVNAPQPTAPPKSVAPQRPQAKPAAPVAEPAPPSAPPQPLDPGRLSGFAVFESR